METIAPDWPAPHTVHAYTTTRAGGVSEAPFHSFNLATHVGDRDQHVQQNRQRLITELALPDSPVWLDQVHGTDVVAADQISVGQCADAVFSWRSGKVCAVMTADCLPLLFCNRQGSVVAAAHAGWRGLAAGVIESTVEAMGVATADLLVWLGPAIGPEVFEVGDEVRREFVDHQIEAEQAFKSSSIEGRWLADLYQLARLRLARCGVAQIYGGDYCTYSDAEHFYSYRRDGETGRMASLIWIAPQ
ncbi:hypothetical protein BOW53_07360 [Solemya pervernicosa gill symbiont]|uniref:Purine nucleoside phosphorylase n=2 Tax=Gammaproteobacteria incertae sedis TaxID=118884 RepID=A0A1T2L658_9GAMM|nr:peptidoglycan editing factor PgeF [Candidatus Reidiella endopervernicosa]OOZ40542.1 hypothetical protein BOW53_07360 [Solemya pervernicosa gill symbiont]QKQ28308.1 peptidoglycan editing factor PgeF [Candidatus Reidiella endopervernicosa]